MAQIYAGAGNAGGSTNYGQDYFGTANSANWKDPYTEQWSLKRRPFDRYWIYDAALLYRLGDSSTGMGSG